MQIEAKKCKAATYESWELWNRGSVFVWAVVTREFGKSFSPRIPSPITLQWPPILPLSNWEKSGPRKTPRWRLYSLVKIVDENTVSRDKMGLLCIFVDDQRSPTTHFSTPGSISYLKSGHFLLIWEVEILVSIIKFIQLFILAHISVKLSIKHVLLWDNKTVNLKTNSVEFRGLTSVNTKQEIWKEICCNRDHEQRRLVLLPPQADHPLFVCHCWLNSEHWSLVLYRRNTVEHYVGYN